MQTTSLCDNIAPRLISHFTNAVEALGRALINVAAHHALSVCGCAHNSDAVRTGGDLSRTVCACALIQLSASATSLNCTQTHATGVWATIHHAPDVRAAADDIVDTNRHTHSHIRRTKPPSGALRREMPCTHIQHMCTLVSM